MTTLSVSTAPKQLALVAGCLLVAAYLPSWHQRWFVAESGHYGGSNFVTWLLLLGLYRRRQLALGLTYALVGLQLVVAGYIMACNSTTGGPLLGFVLTSSLNLLAIGILYCSAAINRYLKDPASNQAGGFGFKTP